MCRTQRQNVVEQKKSHAKKTYDRAQQVYDDIRAGKSIAPALDVSARLSIAASDGSELSIIEHFGELSVVGDKDDAVD